MTVPRHIKIVFRGSFLGTPEVWTFGTKWDKTHAGDPDGSIDNIDNGGVENALTALFGTSSFSEKCRVEEWRAYDIGTDGKMVGNPRLQQVNGTAGVVGTAGGYRYPTDISLCVTTEAANRGPARFGRFYLPGIAVALADDARLSLTATTALVTSVTQFLKDVADSIDVPASPVSTSMLNISAVGAGASQRVNNIRVGRVLDNISRRRRQLVEDYEVSGQIDW